MTRLPPFPCGDSVDKRSVGRVVGIDVGATEGCLVDDSVGTRDGATVGVSVGNCEGAVVSNAVGLPDGVSEG